MPWQVSLIFIYVFYAAQALWLRRYAQQSSLPASWATAISYVLGVMPLSIVAGLLSGRLYITWNRSSVSLLILEGGLIGAFNVFQFIALKQASIARYQTIFQSYELIVIGLGWSLLHEGLDIYQIIGALVLLISAVMAMQAPPHKDNKPLTGYILLMIGLAIICLGVGQIAEKAALHYMDYGAYFIFGFGAQALALLVVAFKDLSRANLALLNKHEIKQSVIMGALIVPIGASYIYAIQKADNVSLVTALVAFTVPLTVLASYVFLHEHENKRLMWSATLLGCAGLVLTAF